MSSPLKICIDARHVANKGGGTTTFTLSLARALSNLGDGDEQYEYLVNPEDGKYLEQELQESLQFIESTPMGPKSLVRRVVTRLPFAQRLAHSIGGKSGAEVARSDGTIERNKIDVIHFTTQLGFLTNIPSIYHPHDLQHRHLPQFFTPRQRAVRDYRYSKLCEHASIVSVVSKWGKQDLIENFNLPESKIRVVHFAPDPKICTQANPETVKAIRQKLSLPERFIYYPARTWAHKNHLRLLQALKILRDRYGLIIPLVCSGEPTEFLPTLTAKATALGVSKQVFFVGFVDFNELYALYQLCSAVVIPTLFEAGSFPLWEAFLSKRPAACSNVTSLPAQAADAALVFDPYSVEEIADAVRRLWTDTELRKNLIQRGSENINRYSWDTTARTFRALYRELGNRSLTPEDEWLLSAPPLM